MTIFVHAFLFLVFFFLLSLTFSCPLFFSLFPASFKAPRRHLVSSEPVKDGTGRRAGLVVSL